MPLVEQLAEQLIEAARELSKGVNTLKFSEPVAYVYNPLEYAWESHRLYLEKYGNSTKRFVLLGMNPGPWGMAQTGVPFGEINAVKEWLNIETRVNKPGHEHPKRPVLGFECPRSEVSGRRLWDFFKERFGTPEQFFKDHFVSNYCPLVFMEEGGRNRTPDKLKPGERRKLFELCDRHLRQVMDILKPEWAIGVGKFTYQRIIEVVDPDGIKTGSILHPSPASPAANRDWSGTVSRQLLEMGVWEG